MRSKIFKNYFFTPKFRFQKKVFSKFAKNPKYFFANFEILIFGGSSATPLAPYASVDVSWIVLDGFRARSALGRLVGTFSSGFPVDFPWDTWCISERYIQNPCFSARNCQKPRARIALGECFKLAPRSWYLNQVPFMHWASRNCSR